LRLLAGIILVVLLAACGSAPVAQKKAGPPPGPKITLFYASPPTIALGERSLLCYGVEEATAVKIEPELEPIKPSFSRCIEAHPKVTTTYRLTAEGKGAPATMEAEIRVGPAVAKQTEAPKPHVIQFFAASAREVPAGGPVTLCYSVVDAASIELTPSQQPVPTTGKACVSVTVTTTTKYVLKARNHAGVEESAEATIAVK
jgi:hypothetical protein